MMIRIIRNWTLTIVALITFAWLTLAPHPLPGDVSIAWFEGADKVVHALMLWGITSAIIFDYKRAGRHSIWSKTTYATPRKMTLKVACALFLVMLTLSVCDEMLQTAMGIGRTGDIYDLLADVVGIIVGIATAPTIVNFMLRARS